ncbi:hypothetical protein SteCoe_12121 [Stentor coeruleus]|uniref:Protein kinase domain-containing protein n=1 Tax=Stentor coeruleus TaxID=5963 RepID=A0A1R2CBJ9_9CILI|nr:hypothetical protein SteCoe_12121 [Stentor coeruleus]
MELKTISTSQGVLKVIERLKNIWKIECYVCRNELGLFYVKIYPLPECEKDFDKENFMITCFTNENLVLKLVEIKKERHRGLLIFEYTKLLSLSERIISLQPQDYSKLIRNILDSLFKVHKSNIIHGNISPETIFVSESLETVLSSFEFSTPIEEVQEQRLNGLPYITHQSIETMAPEILGSGFDIDFSIDMWGLGCIIYQIVCKTKPFLLLEDQKTGKYCEINTQDPMWNAVIKRLLIVDPRFRGNCQEILALINTPVPNEAKVPWSLSSVLIKSTNSWVKLLTQDANTVMDSFIFGKLISKALENPNKIPKFYSSLIKRHIYKPRVCLKCLALLHKYMYVSELDNITTRINEFLDIVQMTWTMTKSISQKFISETGKKTIVQYMEIIREKYRIHSEYRINCDWSSVGTLEAKIIRDLLSYYKSITRFSIYIFELSDFTEIYTDIVKIILSEQQELGLILCKELEEINNLEATHDFFKTNRKNVELIHQVYIKRPYLEIPYTDYLHSNAYASIAKSEILFVESSVSERKLSVNSSESFIFSEPGLIESIKDDFTISNPEDLEFEEVIGKGSSCTVFKGKYREQQVAIKLMKQLTNKNAYMKEFYREIETLSKIRHVNLVGYIGACIGEKSCIVMEYCTGKTLFNLLHERRDTNVSLSQRIKFAKDISEGMAYLHSLTPPIIHRDLKSLNLLLSEPVNCPQDFPTVKITDFGVSRTISTEMMTGHIGTCHWMAPEILKDLPYGLPSDVYSFGIVLWEILSRVTPYKGTNNAVIPFQVINHGRRPDLKLIPENIPKALISLMVKCWDVNPLERPTFIEITKILDNMHELLIP